MEFNINLLQLFEEATEDISSDTYSVALFIPIVNSLSKLLQVDDEDYGIMAMKRKMLLSMLTRFGSCEGQDIYYLSTILDPRFKNRVFSSQAEMHRSQERLIIKCEETIQLNTAESSPRSQDIPSKRARTSQRSDAGSILWATDDDIIKEYDSELDDDYTTCEKMVHSYLGEPNADRHSSPLQY